LYLQKTKQSKGAATKQKEEKENIPTKERNLILKLIILYYIITTIQ
jgi:hypothetical protein